MYELHNHIPKILFDDNGHMKPEVRKVLYDIALLFMYELKIPESRVVDIVLTGSMAGFAYSPYSDIDLHIIMDLSGYDNEVKWLKFATSLFNRSHEFRIHGHDVEVYVQDENEPHISSGVYSLLRDRWIVKPSRPSYSVKANYDRSFMKARDFVITAEKILDSRMSDLERLNYFLALKEKLKNMRKSGLFRNGLYSVENLTFKLLRNAGFIKTLNEIVNYLESKVLSL